MNATQAKTILALMDNERGLLSGLRWLLFAAILGTVLTIFFAVRYLHAVDMPTPKCLHPAMEMPAFAPTRPVTI